MRAVKAAADPRQRFWIRATLVAGMVLSAVALYAVLRSSPLMDAADRPALSKDTRRHVRVLGPADQPVPGAEAFVLSNTGEAPAESSWHPEVGVLELPAPGQDFAVRLTAPGFRVQELPAVRGGQTIRMERGYVARILLRGAGEGDLPEGVRILLRLRPEATSRKDLDDQALVDLMDNLGGPGSGPQRIPRGEFGYPVSLEQARAGVLLPLPGVYHVHWGLMDVGAGTWFSLQERCGRRLEIADQTEAQRFALEMTAEDIQETLAGLEAGVEVVRKNTDR